MSARMNAEQINVCPRDGEPLVYTFEFPQAEWYCVECHWKGGTFMEDRAPATLELAERAAELRYRYDCERAGREGRPRPDPSDQNAPRPTCSGCGKVAEGPLDGDKPAHWYSRTIDARTEYACSRDCITEGAMLPW